MNFHSVICPVHVDLDTNTVSAQGREFGVAPEIAEALFVLARQWPRPVTIDEMTNGLFGVNARFHSVRDARKIVVRAGKILSEQFPGLGIATDYARNGEHGFKRIRTQTEFRLVVSSVRGAA